MKKLHELKQYELLMERRIEDLHSDGYILRHKKSGARIALMSNDDSNKVFYIGFRTPPTDSTGVAHILEHSVLEGSREFPVKDPFIELIKGSLNTFLNAMTYPDKTLYPVASCNDKDFANLMHVYLDAVFYPNIYKEPRIFFQEGWHYELQDSCDELSINGVVYNEMKGAFSSPDDVLEREISTSLYPDTAYANESGGDPEAIPQLTYENFLEFHRKYYHPSNSYIYLYGDMDMAERLAWLDEAYLSAFEQIEVDSSVSFQKPFEKPVEYRKEYPISEGEDTAHKTYLSCNISAGDVLNRDEYVAFQIQDYTLCSCPGAPIKQALLDAGIGEDVYSYFENGIRQPYFSIVAKNADEAQKDEFLKIIENVLAQICKEGLDKNTLYAALNYYEFKYREADFGSYPAGLMYGLQIMDSWLYDETLPFIHIEAGDTYQKLRGLVETDYYEKLISEKLLHNPHRSVLVLAPVKGLEEKREQELAETLAAYKNSLTEQEIQKIIEATRAQEEFAEMEDDPEDLKKIPLLARTDIRRETEPVIYEERKLDDITVLYHQLPTNKITYYRYLFDCKDVPAELFPYLGILKAVLGLVDTADYSYQKLAQQMDLYTGGIGAVTNIYTNAKDLSRQKITFEMKAKVFDDRVKEAVDLTEEIMMTSSFVDEKRIGEILAELRSRMQSSMISAGHSVAFNRALSYVSKTAALSEVLNGMEFYRLVDGLVNDLSNQFADLSEKLSMLCQYLFRRENLMVDVTAAGEEQYQRFAKLTAAMKERLYSCELVKAEPFKVVLEKKNEGFGSASAVQYVCRAGNFISKGLEYTGALRILKGIMNNDYLWNNIRVKGGAYGCMCNFGKSGDSFFVSYRDPNLKKTVDVFEHAAEFAENFGQDERAMDQAVIGTMSELEIPLTAQTKALRALSMYLTEQSIEQLQKEREQILDATAEDIRKLAAHIRAFMEDECLCVVGNSKKIEEEKAIFKQTKSLF